MLAPLRLEAQDAGLDSVRAGIQAERFAEAERAAAAQVRQIEASAPLDSIRLGTALDLQAEALWRGGRAASAGADRIAARAVTIRERTLGRDHEDVAASLHNQANLLRIAGRFDGLDSLYQRVLAIRVHAFGPDHPDVARVLNDYANLMWTMGNETSAESLYVRACRTYERLGPTQLRNVAKCLNNLSLHYQRKGDYARARPLMERSRSLFVSVLPPGHPNIALANINLATTLAPLGERDQARTLLEHALEIHVAALGREHADVAWNLRELGAFHAKYGDADRARSYLEQAIPIHERTLGLQHPELALDLTRLAEVSVSVGRDSEAIALHERALAIHERAFPHGHARVADDLMGVATIRVHRGELADARVLFERAREIRTSTLGPQHPLTAKSWRAIADVQWAMGQAAEAFEATLSAEAAALEHIRLLQQTLPERVVLQLDAERVRGLDLAITIHFAHPTSRTAERVADALIRAHGVVLEEMVGRGRLRLQPADSSLQELQIRLLAARERLSNLTVRGPGNEPAEQYRRLLDDARREREAAEAAYAVASHSRRHEAGERRAGLAEVRNALPANAVLVGYHVLGAGSGTGPWMATASTDSRLVDTRYVACIIRGGTAPVAIVPLGTARAVDSLAIRTNRQIARASGLPGWQMRTAERDYRAAAADLRRAVWDPVDPFVESAPMVFVVPDGALSHVSFAALPDQDGYLIDRPFVLHYLSSERALTRLTEPEPSGRGLLAIGAPAFGSRGPAGPNPPRGATRSAAMTLRGGEVTGNPCAQELPAFAPLPMSGREVRDIGKRWNDRWRQRSPEGEPLSGLAADSAVVLTGSGATEDAFRRLVLGRRVLHLATHGFVLGVDCQVAGGDARHESGAGNGFLAGLAFSDANQRMDSDDLHDGIMTAEEIAGLDLCGIEWTVLSACNTGLGVVRPGEGVFGLRRAVEVAGCRSLVMSLWPVADEGAREWMIDLYDARFSRKLDTATAVRDASRKALEGRRTRSASTHPWYWAGFIAAGDWR